MQHEDLRELRTRSDRRARSIRSVVDSHLSLRSAGKLEDDLRENYAADVVVVDRYRTYRGHDGVRDSARILSQSLPNASFEYKRVVVEGRVGYLVWNADGSTATVTEGVDTFLIEDGKIKMQTIYYRTTPPTPSPNIRPTQDGSSPALPTAL